MRLSALFELKERLRRTRILAGEGVLAAEDRVQLLRFAWEDEKKRLQWIVGLVIAVFALTTIALASLSVATVVHFWQTPHRVAAAWLTAAMGIALCVAAAIALLAGLRNASSRCESARQEIGRDLQWIRDNLGREYHGRTHWQPRAATREELVARIALQRERVAALRPNSKGQTEPSQEKRRASAVAMRLALEHRASTAVTVAAFAALIGPRRLMRWTTVVVPMLWRMR